MCRLVIVRNLVPPRDTIARRFLSVSLGQPRSRRSAAINRTARAMSQLYAPLRQQQHVDPTSASTTHSQLLTWAATAHFLSWLGSLFLCLQGDIVPLVSNSKTLPGWVSRLALPAISAAFHFASFYNMSGSTVNADKQAVSAQRLDQLLLEREETITERDRRIQELEKQSAMYMKLLNKHSIPIPYE